MIVPEAIEHRRSGRIRDDMLPEGFSWAKGGTAIKDNETGDIIGMSNAEVCCSSDVPALVAQYCRLIKTYTEHAPWKLERT